MLNESCGLGSSDSKDGLIDKIIGTCPEVVISIAGVDIKCLYDSGSQVTTVTEGFLEQVLG